MELRHLRYFVQVANELNFTKAAFALRVAQPALSRQIQQLEEEIGAKLLDRSKKKIVLTSAGEAFLIEAQAILAKTQQAVQTARDAEAHREGTLKLGYVWGLFHTVAPAHIADFRQADPRISIYLSDLNANQQASLI